MSRAFSAKKPSLPPPPTALPPTSSLAKSSQAKKQSPRNPLQDLNRISGSSNSSDSSSVSSEAPRGCLGFFLSHSSSSSSKTSAHRPKYISKTPSSAPSVPPLKQPKSKENLSKGYSGEHPKKLTSEKGQKFKKNPPCLYQWQSGKKSASKIGQKPKPSSVLNDHSSFLPRLQSASEESKQREDRLEGINDRADKCSLLTSGHKEATLTPMSKKGTRADSVHLDNIDDGDVEENSNTSHSKTPPIQNSVSPEIQCVSSLVSATTPACYGAGYVVSGVTDKRKCKPRGILIVEEKNSSFHKMVADSSDDDNEKEINGLTNNVNASLLPLPNEASMHWLCSPHNKEDKDMNTKLENGLNEVQGLAESTTLDSISSPLSKHRIALDTSDSIDLSSATNCIRRKTTTSISPSGLPEFQGFSDSILSPSYLPIFFSPNSTPCKAGSSEKGKCCQYNLNDENSPFSLSSLGSGNVIQTPQSNSSSDVHVGLSWVHADNLKEGNSNLDLNSIREVIPSASLFSVQFEDSANSSFRFDCSTLPSDSIDLSKLPKFLDDQDPWLSSSTVENVSQSQMRISWRDGLMSQLYELNEFDCCKCLSDDEDLANYRSSNESPVHHGPRAKNEVDCDRRLNSDVNIAETDDNEIRSEGLVKEIFAGVVSCSAESISTDGGGLVASRDDSDWTSCYKNKLFEL
ncbi:putative serine/threonine-protein kinase nek3 [Senna tora]|uniref:Putative serine/threonine-protein kinase nek3 n=1 Tax=Senna tora TaxID=362788 RepID=A0A835CDG9_9FABA|nr:putative serine/threonine-protein kinase nek3 [Senna tora]